MKPRDVSWRAVFLMVGVIIILLCGYFLSQGAVNDDILRFSGLVVFVLGAFTLGFMLLVVCIALADVALDKAIMWKYLRNSNHWREALVEARRIIDEKYLKKEQE